MSVNCIGDHCGSAGYSLFRILKILLLYSRVVSNWVIIAQGTSSLQILRASNCPRENKEGAITKGHSHIDIELSLKKKLD